MDDPLSLGLSVLALFLAFILVLMNALFVAAEFAFVKARPSRITSLAASGNSLARHAQHCISNLDAYLSVSQLGITLSSLGLGWLGEPAVARLLEPIFVNVFNVTSSAVLHTVAFLIAFSFITVMHVVFGELVPKSLAIQRAERLSLVLAPAMRFFFITFYPAIWLLNGAANRFVRLIGVEPAGEHEKAHTEEELRLLVSESYRSGLLKKSEKELLQNVFAFERKVARDVMVPRPEVVFLDCQRSLDENLATANLSGHTRFPLCDRDLDHILGLVHIKDLSRLQGTSLESIEREIMAVPEGITLDRLLRQFQRNRQHMAIVIDEYGGIVGIITLENVLEELVGQIQDEFDNEPPDVQKEEGGQYLVSGRTLIEEATERFDIPVPEETEYDTLGGLVFNTLGKTPKLGDEVRVGDYRLQVAELYGYRITKVRIIPPDNLKA
ncbi:MAG: HlyC/CorC family transporter [Desulforudis sp.]|nr:MAG: HlyC/CorC family transporter [Desulforudis sp.]